MDKFTKVVTTVLPVVSIGEKEEAEKINEEDQLQFYNKIIDYNKIIKKVIAYERELLLN